MPKTSKSTLKLNRIKILTRQQHTTKTASHNTLHRQTLVVVCGKSKGVAKIMSNSDFKLKANESFTVNNKER